MRQVILITALLALLLAACQGATPQITEGAEVGNSPTAAASATTAPVAEDPNPAEESTATPSAMEPVSSDSPGCTVSSPFPTPGPTEQSLFPPPGEKDWVQGPTSARVTFTEYSDFQ